MTGRIVLLGPLSLPFLQTLFVHLYQVATRSQDMNYYQMVRNSQVGPNTKSQLLHHILLLLQPLNKNVEHMIVLVCVFNLLRSSLAIMSEITKTEVYIVCRK